MSKRNYDICIIGCGPSGAALSMMLSKNKIYHTIIDKANFPRDKTCGDGLVLHVFQVLNEIDPLLLQKFIDNPLFIHSNKGEFHATDNLLINIQGNPTKTYHPIYYGKRIDFDFFLLQNMESKYANIILGNGLKSINRISKNPNKELEVILENGQTLSPNLVVGADGMQSIVGRKLGHVKVDKQRTSVFISAYFEGLEGSNIDNCAEVRIIRRGMPLFFYIFPLNDGQFNVSLGGVSDKVSKKKINLKREVELIIASHPEVMNKFKNAKRIKEWRGWSIPSFFGKTKVSGDNFLLIGDAAGLSNPFYKEGVGTGMMSGLLASKVISKAIENNRFDSDFLLDYDKILDKKVGRLFKFSRLSLKLSNYPIIFKFLVAFLKKRIEKKIPNFFDKRSY